MTLKHAGEGGGGGIVISLHDNKTAPHTDRLSAKQALCSLYFSRRHIHLSVANLPLIRDFWRPARSAREETPSRTGGTTSDTHKAGRVRVSLSRAQTRIISLGCALVLIALLTLTVINCGV